MTATLTTPTTPTAAQLMPLIGYTRTAADVEASGYTFGARTPELGEVVMGYSRGGYRRGIVVKVGKVNATIAYVTDGGVTEAQKILDRAAATLATWPTVAANIDRQTRKNHEFAVQEANPATAKYAHGAWTDTEAYLAAAAERAAQDVDALSARYQQECLAAHNEDRKSVV